MAFTWKKDEVNVRISRLLDTIVNIASEDNVITEDEDAVIEGCRVKLWGLAPEFEKMIEDNLSIDEARAKTKQLFESVISTATDIAKKDGTITSDELILIDRLAKYLRQTDFSELIQ